MKISTFGFVFGQMWKCTFGHSLQPTLTIGPLLVHDDGGNMDPFWNVSISHSHFQSIISGWWFYYRWQGSLTKTALVAHSYMRVFDIKYSFSKINIKLPYYSMNGFIVERKVCHLSSYVYFTEKYCPLFDLFLNPNRPWLFKVLQCQQCPEL